MAAQPFTEYPWRGMEHLRAQVPHDLWTAKQVLVRADKVQPSFEPKYAGQTRVLCRCGKCFAYGWRTETTMCPWTDCVRFMKTRLVAVISQDKKPPESDI
ncbi:hypothetical protein LSAT2_008161 [Lamellibrachia satsuma]|nr:hypothetical protein LSAT2_008161 [Lamellibrachia satsuma]